LSKKSFVGCPVDRPLLTVKDTCQHPTVKEVIPQLVKGSPHDAMEVFRRWRCSWAHVMMSGVAHRLHSSLRRRSNLPPLPICGRVSSARQRLAMLPLPQSSRAAGG
jgi:hypothetical protein